MRSEGVAQCLDTLTLLQRLRASAACPFAQPLQTEKAGQMTQAGAGFLSFLGVGSLVAFGSGRRVVGWQSARRHHRPQSFTTNPHQFRHAAVRVPFPCPSRLWLGRLIGRARSLTSNQRRAIVFLRFAKERVRDDRRRREGRAHGRRRLPALFFCRTGNFSSLRSMAKRREDRSRWVQLGRVRWTTQGLEEGLAAGPAVRCADVGRG